MDAPITPITNLQKYDNYRIQMGRLSRAMRGEFYLEAMFISYAIMEDRTESILKHGGTFNPKKHTGKQGSLGAKLTTLGELSREKKSLYHKCFGDTLASELKEWIQLRNRLIHALLKQSLDEDILKETALEGTRLAKLLSNRTNTFKTRLEKQQEKE